MFQPLVTSEFQHKYPETLLNKESYVKLGNNVIIAASPSVLHFSGYSLHKKHIQVIRIINISKKSTRIQVAYPSQPVFKLKFQKKGLIAPGMSEDLQIEFTPTTWQYYYDCIHIHSEKEHLSIPIHAYPALNEVSFPASINFGLQPLSEKTQRIVRLYCKIPIQFEFEIKIIKSHADISINPLQGTIPPDGFIKIFIEYTPSVMATISSEIKLLISQYEFIPMHCVITGSSSASVHRKNNLVVEEEEEIKAVKITVTKGSKKKKRLKLQKDKEKKEIIKGIQMPSLLEGVAAVNFILTQHPGRLKPKDLKKAIEEQKKIREAQKRQEILRQNALGLTNCTSTEIIITEELEENRVNSRQLKVMEFLKDLQELQEKDKEAVFQSQKDHLGEIPMTEEEIKTILQARQYRKQVKEYRMRENDRIHYSTCSTATLDSKESITLDDLPNCVPDFDLHKNDMWSMRKKIIKKFVQAVSRCIIRLRANRRIKKIKERLENAKTRTSVAALVAQDHRQASIELFSSNEINLDLINYSIQSKGFEEYEINEIGDREVFQREITRSFQDFSFFHLKVPLEYELIGHVKHKIPVYPCYPPLENEQLFSLEERLELTRENTNSFKNEVTEASIDLLEKKINTKKIKLLKSNPNIHVFMELLSSTETDPEFTLLPSILVDEEVKTHYSNTFDSIGNISIPFNLNSKSLSFYSFFRPNQEHQLTSLNDFKRSKSLWNSQDIPSLLKEASIDDQLSESESDNEIERLVDVPTLLTTRSFFSLDLSSKSFSKRNEALEKIQKEMIESRTNLYNRLFKKMEQIDSYIQDPYHPFVLHEYGFEIPCHKCHR